MKISKAKNMERGEGLHESCCNDRQHRLYTERNT